LSRTNAPLIKICMSFIRDGKRCNIRGRDIGKQLSTLIKKSKKKQIPAFLKWLEKWRDGEVEKLIAKGIKTDNVLDKYECLVNLCEDINSLEEVKERIDELFDDTDEKNIIICSTVHKAKGLERDEVFLLKWTCRGWFDNISDSEEANGEINIAYVGSTRSKDKLFLVNKF
jgi:DNA helicase II / ATP-dependent DNA helicase PcrA